MNIKTHWSGYKDGVLVRKVKVHTSLTSAKEKMACHSVTQTNAYVRYSYTVK